MLLKILFLSFSFFSQATRITEYRHEGGDEKTVQILGEQKRLFEQVAHIKTCCFSMLLMRNKDYKALFYKYLTEESELNTTFQLYLSVIGDPILNDWFEKRKSLISYFTNKESIVTFEQMSAFILLDGMTFNIIIELYKYIIAKRNGRWGLDLLIELNYEVLPSKLEEFSGMIDSFNKRAASNPNTSCDTFSNSNKKARISY